MGSTKKKESKEKVLSEEKVAEHLGVNHEFEGIEEPVPLQKVFKTPELKELPKETEPKTTLDMGKVLRDKAKFPAFGATPKKKHDRWGIFPSFEVVQDVFSPNEDFRFVVSLFSHNHDDVVQMQLETIMIASKGLSKGNVTFFLYAANHNVVRVTGLYRAEINFVFKVRFSN